jgi:pyruvate dehydrogenase E1 component alpha subunit
MEMQSLTPSVRPELPRDVVTVIGPDGTADPKTDPKLDTTLVRDIYVAMVRSRMIDERMTALQRQGRIGFHVGALGEEASIIASTAALRTQDWVFPCYREIAALFWRGFPLQTYVNNMFGNADDTVLGRQMPDHYTGREYRYGSVSSPVGTQIPQAVGFAWAAKMRGEPLAAAVFFGEGATSSGDFHAGMNFAGVFKVPVIFLCRNNHWAISVPASQQSASATFADKAAAYGMRGVRCDGNDVLAVYRTVRECVDRAAAGEGPTLVELVTYRLSGHSTSDDPRAYRPDDEVSLREKQDPIPLLRAYLETLGAWSADDETSLRDRVDAELRECIDHAESLPKPALSTMFEQVYAEQPEHLREQQEQCENGPRARDPH